MVLILFFVFRTLASSGKELKDPFLKALAQREEANRSGKMTVSNYLKLTCIKLLIYLIDTPMGVWLSFKHPNLKNPTSGHPIFCDKFLEVPILCK